MNLRGGIIFGEVDTSIKYKNIIIIASGPSVRNIQIPKLKRLNDTYIIAVNGSGDYVPFANAWFTLDPWGLDGPQLPKRFAGKLYAGVSDTFGTRFSRYPQQQKVPRANITYLHRLVSHNYTTITSDTAYTLRLSEDPRCVSTGNSGYGALNIAYHMRPSNVFLLGVDGNQGYWYSSTKTNRALNYLPMMMDSASQQLIDKNIKVYNVSPTSSINTFEKITPDTFYQKLYND